jgi:hypothetical protein
MTKANSPSTRYTLVSEMPPPIGDCTMVLEKWNTKNVRSPYQSADVVDVRHKS